MHIKRKGKIVSNEKKQINVWERISKLWFMVGKMLLDGVRDPEKIANLLQAIVDEKIYLKRLFADEVVIFTETKAVVHIHELVEDATFENMLGNFGKKRRCWKDKEEALRFSREHKDKLGPNANFFELEGGFVASVDLDGGGPPCVYHVDPLSFDIVWRAECRHRVFSPQQ